MTGTLGRKMHYTAVVVVGNGNGVAGKYLYLNDKVITSSTFPISYFSGTYPLGFRLLFNTISGYGYGKGTRVGNAIRMVNPLS